MRKPVTGVGCREEGGRGRHLLRSNFKIRSQYLSGEKSPIAFKTPIVLGRNIDFTSHLPPELLHKLRVALLHLLCKLLASLVQNYTFSRSKFVHYSLFLPAVGWPCQVGDLLRPLQSSDPSCISYHAGVTHFSVIFQVPCQSLT